jgi:hypothetical protein
MTLYVKLSANNYAQLSKINTKIIKVECLSIRPICSAVTIHKEIIIYSNKSINHKNSL